MTETLACHCVCTLVTVQICYPTVLIQWQHVIKLVPKTIHSLSLEEFHLSAIFTPPSLCTQVGNWTFTTQTGSTFSAPQFSSSQSHFYFDMQSTCCCNATGTILATSLRELPAVTAGKRKMWSTQQQEVTRKKKKKTFIPCFDWQMQMIRWEVLYQSLVSYLLLPWLGRCLLCTRMKLCVN